jgi:aldehyde:ferredoxin oxidoreductase
MIKAVTGKILLVNLSDAAWQEEILPEAMYNEFLSGIGLGARLLYERIPAGANALGPDNVLAFLSGILTGTGALFAGRFLVAGKSPLTGGWGDANCGGSLAPAIKQSGFDAIFFSGMAERPVYVHVNDGQVTIQPADDLWGLDTIETEERLIERHGKRARVACIGPAGENLVRFAGIANDRGRMAGRSGLGAVMGSKKLKALVLEGKHKTSVHDLETLKEWSKQTANLMPKGKSAVPAWALAPLGRLMSGMKTSFRMDGLMALGPLQAWGTAVANELSILIGDAPVRNWRGTPAMFPARVVGLRRTIPTQRKKYHCVSCGLGCGSITEYKGRYGETHRPEYETVTAFGSNLLNRNLNAIYDMNEYCNRMGLDSISTGSVVGFVMDCYEQGLLTQEMSGGMAIQWGDSSAIVRLVEMIVQREGIGDLLAEGVMRASLALGSQSERFAFHAGGQELPMHDPRLDPAYGVIYVSDATPGRHTIHNTLEYDMFRLWTRVSWAPEPPQKSPKSDRYLNSEENAMKNAAGSMYKSLLDCAGLCLFGAHMGVDRTGFFELLNAATGLDLSPDEYMEKGRQIQSLRQAFNIKQGIEPAEVCTNPLVTGNPPVQKGPLRGLSYDLHGMRQKFWRAMGWDEKTGHPLTLPMETR